MDIAVLELRFTESTIPSGCLEAKSLDKTPSQSRRETIQDSEARCNTLEVILSPGWYSNKAPVYSNIPINTDPVDEEHAQESDRQSRQAQENHMSHSSLRSLNDLFRAAKAESQTTQNACI